MSRANPYALFQIGDKRSSRHDLPRTGAFENRVECRLGQIVVHRISSFTFRNRLPASL